MESKYIFFIIIIYNNIKHIYFWDSVIWYLISTLDTI